MVRVVHHLHDFPENLVGHRLKIFGRLETDERLEEACYLRLVHRTRRTLPIGRDAKQSPTRFDLELDDGLPPAVLVGRIPLIGSSCPTKNDDLLNDRDASPGSLRAKDLDEELLIEEKLLLRIDRSGQGDLGHSIAIFVGEGADLGRKPVVLVDAGRQTQRNRTDLARLGETDDRPVDLVLFRMGICIDAHVESRDVDSLLARLDLAQIDLEYGISLRILEGHPGSTRLIEAVFDIERGPGRTRRRSTPLDRRGEILFQALITGRLVERIEEIVDPSLGKRIAVARRQNPSSGLSLSPGLSLEHEALIASNDPDSSGFSLEETTLNRFIAGHPSASQRQVNRQEDGQHHQLDHDRFRFHLNSLRTRTRRT